MRASKSGPLTPLMRRKIHIFYVRAPVRNLQFLHGLSSLAPAESLSVLFMCTTLVILLHKPPHSERVYQLPPQEWAAILCA